MHLHYLTRFTTAHGRLAEGERAFQWWRRDFGMGWGDLEKQKAYPSRFPRKRSSVTLLAVSPLQYALLLLLTVNCIFRTAARFCYCC